jgi:formylglycine-generating enzyme required for sulfatase activity
MATKKNSIGMETILIPAGKFTMGCGSLAKSIGREYRPHKVTLTKPFYLGVYQVTQQQYKRVMGSNPSCFKGTKNPVEKVSWKDAVEFCRKLSALPEEKAAGRVYGLPTEAEWEYACRAGTDTEYSFGNDASDLGDYAWVSFNSEKKTHPVGQKLPNPWGLYDMHGNVWEWCQDRYGDYSSGAVTDPQGPKSGSKRVFRGGDMLRSPNNCGSAIRNTDRPVVFSLTLGFRVLCRSVE